MIIDANSNTYVSVKSLVENNIDLFKYNINAIALSGTTSPWRR